MLDGVTIDAPEDSDPGMELPVEVHPMQLDGNQATGRYWLPAYFAQWSGASLVLPDEDAAALYHTEEAGGAPSASGSRRSGSMTSRCATAIPTSSACG